MNQNREGRKNREGLMWQISKQVKLEIKEGEEMEKLISKPDTIEEIKLTQPNSNQTNLYFLRFYYVQSLKYIQMFETF